MNKIPKKIHLVYLKKNEAYPELFLKCVDRIKALHKTWEVIIYNEDDADKIIDQNASFLKDIYNGYSHLVQRADIFRVLIVYLFGGFYLDMDIYCLKPLDDLRRFSLIVAEEKTLSTQDCISNRLKVKLRIANYMFASVPGHSFWLIFLEKSIAISSMVIKNENDILESTGPGLLSNIFAQKRKLYPDIVLLNNEDRICMNPGHRQVSCHFGNYAAHLHQGTWRWEHLHKPNEEEGISKLSKEQIAKAVAAIRLLMPKKTERVFKLNIVKPADNDKGFNAIYNSIKKLSAFNFSKRVTIACGSPLYHFNLTTNTTNILYTTFKGEKIIKGWTPAINKQFKYCIVTDHFSKMQFVNAGVSIPIFIVQPGFSRHARNFYEDIDIPTFNLFLVARSSNITYLKALAMSCDRLIENEIPAIRLNVYFEDEKLKESFKKELQFKSIKIISHIGSKKAKESWLMKTHCCLILNGDESFPFEHYENLYMGIPCITNKSIYTQSVINMKYFNVIDLEPTKIDHESLQKEWEEKFRESILNVFSSYEKQQKLAERGSRFIEDKCLPGDTHAQLLHVINTL